MEGAVADGCGGFLAWGAKAYEAFGFEFLQHGQEGFEEFSSGADGSANGCVNVVLPSVL